MKCLNCGADLSDDTKFCSYCGAKMENVVNASMPPKTETNIGDMAQDEPSGNYSQNSSTAKSSHGEKLKEKLHSSWKSLDLFCKVATISIVVGALLLIVSICVQKGFAIFFSVLQLASVFAALLMHKGKIKLDQKKGWIKYLVLIIAILFTVPNVMSYSWVLDNRTNHTSQTAYSDPSTTEKPIVITTVSAPYGSSDCVGKAYASIKSDFVNAGFVSVEVEKVEDLQSTEADKVDTVELISIGGKADFAAEQEFDKYDAVIIRYHAFEPYNVTIHVDFVSNLIFSTYDVNLLINGEKKGTLEHGKNMDFEFDLAPGEYTLTYENAESSSVKGEVLLTVDCNIEASYKISCYSDKVSVEKLYVNRLKETESSSAAQTTPPKDNSDFKTETFAQIKFLIDSSWEKQLIDERCLYYPPVSEPTGFLQCSWSESQIGDVSTDQARTLLDAGISEMQKNLINVEEFSRTYYKIGNKNAIRVIFYHDLDGNDINSDKRGIVDIVVMLFHDGISTFTALFTETEYNVTYSQIIQTAIESIELDAEATSSDTSSNIPVDRNTDGEALDLNAINNTNSADFDKLFIGKTYCINGIVGEAIPPSDGFNALVIIHPDVSAKGMGGTLPLDINIWMNAEDFKRIGGESSAGNEIEITAVLTSISRNAISKDTSVKGYPIELEFGQP